MIEYFQHDYHTRNDPKMQKILLKLGHEGKSVFWDLVEMMYENNGKLMLSECESYAFALRTKCELIMDLVNNFDVFKISECGTFFYSDGINKRLSFRLQKSAKAQKSANFRWQKPNENKEVDANAMRTHSEGNAIIGIGIVNNSIKDSKKKKVDAPEINISFDEFWEHYEKKVGDKKKLVPKWERLTNDERVKAMKHISEYKIAEPDKAFRKHPETYLNQKSFNDEIIYKNKNGIQQQQQPTTRIYTAQEIAQREKLLAAGRKSIAP